MHRTHPSIDAASPAPLPLNRAGRLAARQLPGWTIRYLPAAVTDRRWRAQTRRPLTRKEIDLGFPGAVHGPTLDTVVSRVRAARMVAFLTTARRWRR